jgi:hypothetical protein
VQRGETAQLDALLPSLTYFSVSAIGRGSWQSVEPLPG